MRSTEGAYGRKRGGYRCFSSHRSGSMEFYFDDVHSVSCIRKIRMSFKMPFKFVKTLWPSFAPDDGVFFGPLPALKAAMKVVVEGAKEAGIDIFSNAIFFGVSHLRKFHGFPNLNPGVAHGPEEFVLHIIPYI